MSPTLNSIAARIGFDRLEAALVHLEATLRTGNHHAQDLAAQAVEEARAELAPFLPHNQK